MAASLCFRAFLQQARKQFSFSVSFDPEANMIKAFQGLSPRPSGFLRKLRRYQKHLNGSTIEFDLTPYQAILAQIHERWAKLGNSEDSQIRAAAQLLTEKARNRVTQEDLVAEAFALATSRVLNVRPFDVQILGGLAMHQGKLVEMQTGEGKTLAGVFPAFLNALSGKGVHVLTFNDYLARRDAEWMGPIYRFLGLSVEYIDETMTTHQRQAAYRSDITYLTVKEAGFDFLRDSRCYSKSDMVHRELHFAIVDEADSILIDEARVMENILVRG